MKYRKPPHDLNNTSVYEKIFMFARMHQGVAIAMAGRDPSYTEMNTNHGHPLIT